MSEQQIAEYLYSLADKSDMVQRLVKNKIGLKSLAHSLWAAGKCSARQIDSLIFPK